MITTIITKYGIYNEILFLTDQRWLTRLRMSSLRRCMNSWRITTGWARYVFPTVSGTSPPGRSQELRTSARYTVQKNIWRWINGSQPDSRCGVLDISLNRSESLSPRNSKWCPMRTPWQWWRSLASCDPPLVHYRELCLIFLVSDLGCRLRWVSASAPTGARARGLSVLLQCLTWTRSTWRTSPRSPVSSCHPARGTRGESSRWRAPCRPSSWSRTLPGGRSSPWRDICSLFKVKCSVSSRHKWRMTRSAAGWSGGLQNIFRENFVEVTDLWEAHSETPSQLQLLLDLQSQCRHLHPAQSLSCPQPRPLRPAEHQQPPPDLRPLQALRRSGEVQKFVWCLSKFWSGQKDGADDEDEHRPAPIWRQQSTSYLRNLYDEIVHWL